MKRKVALVMEIPYEKVYNAILYLQLRKLQGKLQGWVNIDEVHQFLLKQQEICERTDGKEAAQFGLYPRSLYPLGWQEDYFVRLLAELELKGLILVNRTEKGNFFQAVSPDDQGLYQTRRHSEHTKAVEDADKEKNAPPIVIT